MKNAFWYIIAAAAPPHAALVESLEARVAEGRPISVREVLEAAYLPYLALLMNPAFGPTAAKFMSRLLVEADEELQGIINRTVGPYFMRSLSLLREAMPHLDEETMKLRSLITVTNVIHGAGDLQALQNSPFGDVSGGDPLNTLHQLFEYMAAALAAPATPLTPAIQARMAATLLAGANP